MPVVSNKSLQMPESPIRKLVPFAEEAVRMNKEVLYLNIGQPDINSPEVALDRIKNIDRTVIEYSHSAGFSSYREGLAKYYKSAGISVDPSNIIVTTGGSEALLFGIMTCFEPGDEVIIPEPFYANYNSFSMAAGIKVVPITTSIEDGFALPPISEFEKVITEKTKGILICNPGNPTGTLYSKKELSSLRKIVMKHDLFLFADEVYREFVYEGNKHQSVMNLRGIDQHTVLIDSVSKRYSMCGARVGALVSRNKQVTSTVLKFAQARLSPPTFGQIASEAALDTPPEYFDEVIAEYVSRRDLMIEGLNKIDGVRSPKPLGAFYTIAELPVDDAEYFCQWMLSDFEHNGHTVMMAPASGFYATPDIGTTQVRIAYVLDKEKLKQALECIEEGLKKYPGRTT